MTSHRQTLLFAATLAFAAWCLPFVFPCSLTAQMQIAPEWQWANVLQGSSRLTTSEQREIRAVQTDLDGNVFAFAVPQNRGLQRDVLTSQDNMPLALDSNYALVKFSPQGSLMRSFVRRIVGSNAVRHVAMALDSVGNCFLAGTYTAPIDLYYGSSGRAPESLTLPNGARSAVFIAKYFAKSDSLWVRRLGVAQSTVECSALASDRQGNVYLAGTFGNASSSLVFDDRFGRSVGTTSLRNPNANATLFVFKCDSNGTALWSRQSNNPQSVTVATVLLDADGSCVLVGNFTQSLTFEDAPALIPARVGSSSGFLAKYAATNGQFRWAHSVDMIIASATIVRDSLLLAGTVLGNGGMFTSRTNGRSLPIPPLPQANIVIARYDTEGNIDQTFPPITAMAGSLTGVSLLADMAGDCYISTSYSALNLDFAQNTVQRIGAGENIAIFKYIDGKQMWARTLGINSLTPESRILPHGMTIDRLGAIFLVGTTTQGDIRFEGLTTLVRPQEQSAFLARLTPSVRAFMPSQQIQLRLDVLPESVQTLRSTVNPPDAMLTYRMTTTGGTANNPAIGATIQVYDSLSNPEQPLQALTTDAAGQAIYTVRPAARAMSGSYALTFQATRVGVLSSALLQRQIDYTAAPAQPLVPAVPTLISPAAMATGVSDMPILVFASVQHAVSYTIQISTDIGFATSTITLSTNTSALAQVMVNLQTALSSGTVYFWRVRALGAGGTASAFSEIRFFTTQARGIPMIEPQSGAMVTTPNSAILQWGAVQNAVRYQLRVSLSRSLSPPLVDTTTMLTQYELRGLAASTTYFWQVVAIIQDNSQRQSDTVTFATAPSPSLRVSADGLQNGASSFGAMSFGAIALQESTIASLNITTEHLSAPLGFSISASQGAGVNPFSVSESRSGIWANNLTLPAQSALQTRQVFVRFLPTVVGDASVQLNISSSGANASTSGSILLRGTGVVPILPATLFLPQNLTAAPGDTVLLPLLISPPPSSLMPFAGATIEVRFNRSLLYPLDSTLSVRTEAGAIRVLTLTLPNTYLRDSTLLNVPLVVALGNDTATTLALKIISSTSASGTVTSSALAKLSTRNGRFTLQDVYRNGRLRLIARVASITALRPNVSKNSSAEMIEADVWLANAAEVRLTVINAQGAVIATVLETSIAAGMTTLPVRLPTLAGGVYFLRLESATTPGMSSFTSVQPFQVIR